MVVGKAFIIEKTVDVVQKITLVLLFMAISLGFERPNGLDFT